MPRTHSWLNSELPAAPVGWGGLPWAVQQPHVHQSCCSNLSNVPQGPGSVLSAGNQAGAQLLTLAAAPQEQPAAGGSEPSSKCAQTRGDLTTFSASSCLLEVFADVHNFHRALGMGQSGCETAGMWLWTHLS